MREERLTGADGVLCTPEGEPRGALLVLSGSSGRVQEDRCRVLAAHGYVALSPRWFGGPNAPEQLREVPVESFAPHLDRLAGLGTPDLGVVGTSFGAVAALLLGIADERLDTVVALAPSHLVWAAPVLTESGAPVAASAFSWRGDPLHYVPLVDMMRWQLTIRAEFERLRASDPETLTDLERAARFYYLQRTAFGGKVSGRTFGVAPTGPARFDITKLVPELEALHARLAGVVIECLDFGAFLQRYDRPTTLFYLDPPYYGCEDDYGAAVFSREDFDRLAAVLSRARGKFLLSINDTPEVRVIFAAFTLTAVATTYTIAHGDNAKVAGELIISNFALPEAAP